MAVSKVIVNNVTKVDLTSDTVAPNNLLSGNTAHNKAGLLTTGNINSKAAATYTPTTSNQIIAAGQYLSGAQTIRGDANLVAANIAKGVSIFGVQGAHSGGSGGKMTDDIRFFDYDGTLLYSCSTDDAWDFASEDFPDPPSHEGLLSQGWNISETDLISYLQNTITYYDDSAYPHTCLDIGATYITDDDKTRLYVYITDALCDAPFRLCLGVSGTVIVDWGDGSDECSITGSYLTSTYTSEVHSYSWDNNGDPWIITITIPSGSQAAFVSTGANYIPIIRPEPYSTNTQPYQHAAWLNTIRKIELGSNMKINQYGCKNLYSLETITLPSGTITSASSSAFSNCYSLKALILPSTVTYIGERMCENSACEVVSFRPFGITQIGKLAFQSTQIDRIAFPYEDITAIPQSVCYTCRRLKQITMPLSGCGDIVSIADTAFSSYSQLEYVYIPNDIVSIGSQAFYCLYRLKKIDWEAIQYSAGTGSTVTIGSQAFSNLYTMRELEIHNVATIPGSLLISDYGLESLTIGSDTTSIGASAFANCYSLRRITFYSTTPPTVANSNAFTNLQTFCEIHVPSSSLNSYKSATNYPDPSTYTYVGD